MRRERETDRETHGKKVVGRQGQRRDALPQAKGCRSHQKPEEARKNSPQRTLDGTGPRWQRDPGLQNCSGISSVILSYQVYGNLLQQPWEMNIFLKSQFQNTADRFEPVIGADGTVCLFTSKYMLNFSALTFPCVCPQIGDMYKTRLKMWKAGFKFGKHASFSSNPSHPETLPNV